MFGIDFGELLIILIIAVLVLGPDKLPEAMVKVAKFIKSAKKMISDAKYSIDSELQIADLKEETLKYKKELDEATESLNSFKNINPAKDAEKVMSEIRNDVLTNTYRKDETIETVRETVTFKKKSIESSTDEDK
jgi:sec-independent protein translocase protein TatB